MAKKTLLFHGGPLESEYFGGATFWTNLLARAKEYAGYSETDPDYQIWAMRVDESKETFVVDDDEDRGNLDADEAWDDQTQQIVAAFAAGATIFCSEDGWALNHRGRRVRRIR